ncbi:MAG: hypothetical protein E4H20_07315 [Spirochaetales bacterium]|nr:MAG: hypothetical protein E4H20_07315 [Spirochaetales bacterium]
MKRVLFVVAIAIISAGIAFAGPAATGVGVFLGQPTGLTVGLDLSPTNWLDFKAAWNFADPKGGFSIILQGNYDLAFPGALIIEGEDIVPFVGIGAEAAISDNLVEIGFHLPFGLDYRFRKAPIELFLEAGLGLYLFPATKFSGSGGLGIRYRF